LQGSGTTAGQDTVEPAGGGGSSGPSHEEAVEGKAASKANGEETGMASISIMALIKKCRKYYKSDIYNIYLQR